MRMTSGSKCPEHVAQRREGYNMGLWMHTVSLIHSRTYYVPGKVLCAEYTTAMSKTNGVQVLKGHHRKVS